MHVNKPAYLTLLEQASFLLLPNINIFFKKKSASFLFTYKGLWERNQLRADRGSNRENSSSVFLFSVMLFLKR